MRIEQSQNVCIEERERKRRKRERENFFKEWEELDKLPGTPL